MSWYLMPPFCSAQLCPAIRSDHVSGAAFACFRDTLPQHGMLLGHGEAGSINGPQGAKGSFTWDSRLELLSVMITSLPLLASCRRAASEILDFGQACTGTDVVTQITRDSTQEIWRVDSPDVRRQETAYPMIPLEPGDSVRVTAGGCAQTGGHGNTWRLYVDPRNDQLHHGSIKFPGQTSFLRLKDLRAGEAFVIPATLDEAVLRLGFEDSDYTDNGYWGRDPGPNGECRNQPNAWVEIIVGHPARKGRNDDQ
jgi:hypothetical protein